MSKRAWAPRRSRGVSRGGAAPSADLGGSSTYSNGNFEGRGSKGSVATADGHGLSGPKAWGKPLQDTGAAPVAERGAGQYSGDWHGYCVATRASSKTAAPPLAGFSVLLDRRRPWKWLSQREGGPPGRVPRPAELGAAGMPRKNSSERLTGVPSRTHNRSRYFRLAASGRLEEGRYGKSSN